MKASPLRTMLVASSVFAIVGCGVRGYTWTSRGAFDADQFRRDQYQCQTEIDAVYPTRDFAAALAEVIVGHRMSRFKACMEARGYAALRP